MSFSLFVFKYGHGTDSTIKLIYLRKIVLWIYKVLITISTLEILLWILCNLAYQMWEEYLRTEMWKDVIIFFAWILKPLLIRMNTDWVITTRHLKRSKQLCEKTPFRPGKPCKKGNGLSQNWCFRDYFANERKFARQLFLKVKFLIYCFLFLFCGKLF